MAATAFRPACRRWFRGVRAPLASHRGVTTAGALRDWRGRSPASISRAAASHRPSAGSSSTSPDRRDIARSSPRRCFAAPAAVRDDAVLRLYRPHRDAVRRHRRATRSRAGDRVLHVSSHSFTPVLDGVGAARTSACSTIRPARSSVTSSRAGSASCGPGSPAFVVSSQLPVRGTRRRPDDVAAQALRAKATTQASSSRSTRSSCAKARASRPHCATTSRRRCGPRSRRVSARRRVIRDAARAASPAIEPIARQRRDDRARGAAREQRAKRAMRGDVERAPCAREQVALGRDRHERQAELRRRRANAEPDVRAACRDRRGDRGVRELLVRVAGERCRARCRRARAADRTAGACPIRAAGSRSSVASRRGRRCARTRRGLPRGNDQVPARA